MREYINRNFIKWVHFHRFTLSPSLNKFILTSRGKPESSHILDISALVEAQLGHNCPQVSTTLCCWSRTIWKITNLDNQYHACFIYILIFYLYGCVIGGNSKYTSLLCGGDTRGHSALIYVFLNERWLGGYAIFLAAAGRCGVLDIIIGCNSYQSEIENGNWSQDKGTAKP